MDLQKRLEEQLCLKLSLDKCDLAASSDKAAAAVRARLGKLAGATAGPAEASLLGVTVRAGCRKRKRQGVDAVRKKRMAMAKKRRRRNMRLWREHNEAKK